MTPSVFRHLLAVEYHVIADMPDAIFVTGWNDGFQLQVCYAIAERLHSDKQLNTLFEASERLVKQLQAKAPPDTPIEWGYGLSYVSAWSGLQDWTLQLDPIRMYADDYAAVVALAERGV